MGEKRYLCLHDIPLFSSLSKESFATICHAAGKRLTRKGDVLFRQGDMADTIYIIKEGNFKLVRITEDGAEAILQLVGPGQVMGESALFRKNAIHPVTAVAMEESRVCSITGKNLEGIIKADPDLAWHMIESLGSRLNDTWELLAESNTQKTREKILSLFIRLAQEYGDPCLSGQYIRIRLTQQEIASFVGVSRVMAAQVIHELIADNYLIKDKKNYILRTRCF